MKLEVWGGKKDYAHYSAHGEYDPAVDPPLERCPFCGSEDLIVENSHTPYYAVECQDCGAHGPNGQPAKYNGRHIRSRNRCEALHREAFAAAIAAWNRRP